MQKMEEMIEGRGASEEKNNKVDSVSETRKWQSLANVLQNKSNVRLSSTEYLIGRASLMIAVAAFLVPSILEQEMPWPFSLLSSIFVVASLILMAISIFTAPMVPD